MLLRLERGLAKKKFSIARRKENQFHWNVEFDWKPSSYRLVMISRDLSAIAHRIYPSKRSEWNERKVSSSLVSPTKTLKNILSLKFHFTLFFRLEILNFFSLQNSNVSYLWWLFDLKAIKGISCFACKQHWVFTFICFSCSNISNISFHLHKSRHDVPRVKCGRHFFTRLSSSRLSQFSLHRTSVGL